MNETVKVYFAVFRYQCILGVWIPYIAQPPNFQKVNRTVSRIRIKWQEASLLLIRLEFKNVHTRMNGTNSFPFSFSTSFEFTSAKLATRIDDRKKNTKKVLRVIS